MCNYKYTDCVTSGGKCPNDYQLVSCNTYKSDAALGSWYTVSNTTCYVEADNFKNQYATSICCQLRELQNNSIPLRRRTQQQTS